MLHKKIYFALKKSFLKKLYYGIIPISLRIKFKNCYFDYLGFGVTTKAELWKSVSDGNDWNISVQHLEETPVALIGGISRDVGFELEFINHFGGNIIACDPTPSNTDFIRKIERKYKPNFVYEQIALSGSSKVKQLFARYNAEGEVDYLFDTNEHPDNNADLKAIEIMCKSVQDVMDGHNVKHLSLLKIDIEGAEFEVLDSILSKDIEIKQIAVEFHYRFYPDGLDKMKDVFSKLKNKNYELAYRCPSCMDYLFIKA